MKKTKKQKQPKKTYNEYFITIFVLFLGVVSLIFLERSHIAGSKVSKYLPAKKITKVLSTPTPVPIFTPTPTATPTATLTPTPAYVGFCLRVPVLMYHHVLPTDQARAHGQTSLNVDPSFFDSQMAYVSTHYVSVSAQQLIDALRMHTKLPGNAIVVTIDDGYEDTFTNAYPILQRYHITTSLFIPTGLLGINGNNSYLTWDQLGQMVNSGYIFAYDHTWSHYPIGSGSQEKDQYEIMTAKQQLESHLGRPVNIFSNPYGSGSNNPRVIALLIQDGFTGAFSTVPGIIQCDSSIYMIRRTRIGNSSLPSYGL